MSKTLLQFSVLVALFLLTWFGLSKVDFMTCFHLHGISQKMEKKIGDNIIKTLRKSNGEIEDDSVKVVLDKIKNRICTYNAIDPDDIQIHLIRSDVVNAYALPGHHIIIYTGLIKKCDSATELCGVISHELGHIELNHVMKRLVSEIGITVLASVATKGNSQVAGSIIKTLSSSAFERSQETDADRAAVKYMENAHINPKGYADLMLKFADMQSGMPRQLEWISSHPDSKKRAEDILNRIDTLHQTYFPVINANEWKTLKDAAVQQ